MTKLGLHILRQAGCLGEYIAAKPAVVKLVGDWGLAEQVPPGTLVIGRKFCDEYDAQLQYTTGKTPQQAAQQFMDDQMATYAANPAITYWEGHNEPVWNSEEEMNWYASLEIERMRLMAQEGLKCVIGNFATGTPPLDLWMAFLPALYAAKNYEAILGLHEYSCPWMWWMTGKHQVDPNEDQGDEGWTTLRYRKAYRNYIIPCGVSVPLVITECGIDPMVSPQPDGCPGGTWRQLGDYWREHDGETDKADYYFRQLLWYDEELQKDDYVIGATIFTWGNFGKPWADFDIAGTDVARKLIAYTKDNPTKPFQYPQGQQRGDPRVQYRRTYVLLPPGTDTPWATAVAKATWNDHRYTIGGSADDAGIGDLDARHVIAVNPSLWDSNLTEFFDTYYPGVEITVIQAGTPDDLQKALSGNDNGEDDNGEDDNGQDNGSNGDTGNEPWDDVIIDQLAHNDDCPSPLQNGWWQRTLDQIDAVTIHHTYGSHDPYALAASYIHKEGGRPSIPYTVWVQKNGTILLCNALTEGCWHDHTGHKNTHLSIGMAGMLNEVPPTDDQLRATARVCKWAIQSDQLPGIGSIFDITGHMDWTATSCPGWASDETGNWEDDFYRILRAMLNDEDEGFFPMRGVHDRAGADWLLNEGLRGWALLPVYLGTDSQALGLQRYTDNDIRIIVNLRYSYAVDDGGRGTIPGPNHLDAFEAACLETMRHNPDAWGFAYCNEFNNPREWPKDHKIMPGYYLSSYNRIWTHKPDSTRLMPGAIDPFNAGWGDWRTGWGTVLSLLEGANGLTFHAYTHGPDLSLITGERRFGDNPLKEVFYDLRVLESQQAIVPSSLLGLPQIVTETNHLYKRDGSFGWEPDAGEWVTRAFDYFHGRGVQGACLFRFNFDDWRFGDKPQILEALRRAP